MRSEVRELTTLRFLARTVSGKSPSAGLGMASSSATPKIATHVVHGGPSAAVCQFDTQVLYVVEVDIRQQSILSVADLAEFRTAPDPRNRVTVLRNCSFQKVTRTSDQDVENPANLL